MRSGVRICKVSTVHNFRKAWTSCISINVGAGLLVINIDNVSLYSSLVFTCFHKKCENKFRHRYRLE